MIWDIQLGLRDSILLVGGIYIASVLYYWIIGRR
jgi:hypothetical protein